MRLFFFDYELARLAVDAMRHAFRLPFLRFFAADAADAALF